MLDHCQRVIPFNESSGLKLTIDIDTPNADPVRVGICIDQPEAAELYYASCGKIDQHNRHRQASLMLETKLKTLNWNVRLNLTLFGMCVVDSFLLMQGTQGVDCMEQRTFYEMLAEQLIDNTYDVVGLRPRKRRVDDDGTTSTSTTGRTLHPCEEDSKEALASHCPNTNQEAQEQE